MPLDLGVVEILKLGS